MIGRVSATPSAIALIKKLQAQYGDIIFYQSGGCCEGSGPMCMPANEFKTTPSDVKLGVIEGAIYYMGHSHYQFCVNTHTILDAVPGSSGSFSIDCGSGFAFITSARLYTDEELAVLPPAEVVGL